jgi:uncharacterized protein
MHPTLLLAIATLALVVGPLLERVGRRLPALAAWIDGATVGGIVVVAFVHLLPEAGAHLGAWTLVLFAVGLILPTVGERLVRETGQGMRFGVGGLVLVLLLLHEVIESAALASKAHDERIGLATLLVIVGHRLPLGLFLWGHTRRRLGLAWAAIVLGSVAVASFAGPHLVPERFREGGFSAVLSALLAGGLLHLVLQHRPPLGRFEHEPRKRNAWSAVGLAMAAGFFVPYLMGVDVGHRHESQAPHMPERLWELVQQVSVPLCIGLLAISFSAAFLPRLVVALVARGSRFGQAAVGAAVGALLPVRSRGVLPEYRDWIERGTAPAAAFALLIATPTIGVDSILLTLKLLGGPATLARVVCALLLALVVGSVVGGLVPARRVDPSGASAAPRDSMVAAIGRGLIETWSHLAPWMLLGLGVTALVEPWISSEWVSSLPVWAQIGLLGLAGVPSYVCASAATPFAALLLAKGFAPGAVLAFLMSGPSVNLATFASLRRVHSRKVALAFAATAMLAIAGLALAAGELLGSSTAPELAATHEHGSAAWIASFLLALLTLWILAREGPRAVLAQLWPDPSPEHSGHACEHADPREPARPLAPPAQP